MITAYPFVFEHPSVNPSIFTFHLQPRLGLESLEHKVIVAVGTVLVAFIKVLSIFSEAFFTLFACERHFILLPQSVALLLLMAGRTVKPFSAARSPDGNLRIQDVLTHVATGIFVYQC